MFKRALAGREKALGRDHMSTLDTVNSLGLLYYDQGKWPEAEEMYNRALAGKEKALGRDHISTLDTVNNLGILYKEQEKWPKAKEMYNRALEGKEKALGRDHMSTLDPVNNLGTLYSDQAKEMYIRALEGKEKAVGRDHKSTMDTIYCMALLMEKHKDLKGASEMLEQAFIGYKNLLGAEYEWTVNARVSLEKIRDLQKRNKVNTRKGLGKKLRQLFK